MKKPKNRMTVDYLHKMILKYRTRLTIRVEDTIYGHVRSRAIVGDRWCFWSRYCIKRSADPSCWWLWLASTYDQQQITEMFRYDRRAGLAITKLTVGRKTIWEKSTTSRRR